MPNIKTYDQPALEIRPTEVGVESTAAAARRSGAFFNQAAAAVTDTGQRYGNVVSVAGNMAVKYIEHRELSAGAAQFAQMQDGIVNAWNETAKRADPNDPSTAAEFRSGMEPTLEKFKQSFITEGGQRWAQAHTERLREHMFAKTSADMSAMSATAVQQNALKTVNSLGNTTYNDPSSLPLARDTLKGTVEGLIGTSPTMSAVQANKVREELLSKGEEHIVNQAVRGAIAKGGDWQRLADDPKNAPFLDRAELEKAAKTQERAARTDERYNKQVAEEKRQDASDKRTIEILTALRDNPGSVSAREALNDPLLTRADREHTARAIDQFTKPEPAARVSEATLRNLSERINKPYGDPERITSLNTIREAYNKGGLTWAHFQHATKEFIDARSPEGEKLAVQKQEFYDSVKTTITKANPLLGKLDPDGDLNLGRLKWDVDAKIEEYKSTGKNPHDLFNPYKPDYIGNSLDQYKKPLQKSIQDSARRLTGSGAPREPGAPTPVPQPGAPTPPKEPVRIPVIQRKPGETTDEFVKRMRDEL